MNELTRQQLQIPAQVLWLNAQDTARMLGYENADSFLRDVACSPAFPQPSTAKDRGRPRWNAQEVIDYQAAQASALCYLYRHFDVSGNLLYVGISLSAIGRLQQHIKGSCWAQQITRVEICKFQTRDEALIAEAIAIATEKPMHNIVQTQRKMVA